MNFQKVIEALQQGDKWESEKRIVDACYAYKNAIRMSVKLTQEPQCLYGQYIFYKTLQMYMEKIEEMERDIQNEIYAMELIGTQEIPEDSKGQAYEAVFSDFLQPIREQVKHIIIWEPQLSTLIEVTDLKVFLNFALHFFTQLRSFLVITIKNEKFPALQSYALNELVQGYRKANIEIHVEYEKLVSPYIIFDSRKMVMSELGVHFYKPDYSWPVYANNYAERACLKNWMAFYSLPSEAAAQNEDQE